MSYLKTAIDIGKQFDTNMLCLIGYRQQFKIINVFQDVKK